MWLLEVQLTEVMTLQSRILGLALAVGVLASPFGRSAQAKMVADVNCRAWGARFDAPALLDRMLDRRASRQTPALAQRVCQRPVSSRTRHILGQVPRAKGTPSRAVPTISAAYEPTAVERAAE
jgi:hypothetical protein